MKLGRLAGLTFLLGSICLVSVPTRAATEEDLARIRRQFEYGRRLVSHCAYLAHDNISFASCTFRAVWWTQKGCCVAQVSNAIQSGAHVQALIMEFNVGSARLNKELHDDIKHISKGDAETFCALWAIDCSIIKRWVADTQSSFELLDRIEAKQARQKKR